MKNERGNAKSFLVKLILFLGIIVLVFISGGIYKEMSQKKQIQDRIAELQQEANRISRDNALTQEKIVYLESKDYQEKAAKDNLNLQSPDENTVIVKPSVASDATAPKEDKQIAPVAAPQEPIYTKWWNYFFKY
jgi:cell division protein FtsB